MSLLLDALKRAEDAKRAKALSGVEPPAPSSAPNVGSAETAPADHRISVPEFPVLSLEQIDTRPPDPVTTSSLNPAADMPASGAKRQKLSIDELRLAELQNLEMSPVQSSEAPREATPKSGATAAFRAARSATSQTAATNRPTAADSAMMIAALEPAPDAAALAAKKTERDSVKNVFAVKLATQQESKSKWAIPAAAVAIIGVGVGGWYVWNEINKISKPSITQAPSNPVASKPSTATAPPAAVAPTPSAPPIPSPQSTATGGGINPPPTNGIAAVDIPSVLPPLLPPPATAIVTPKAITSAPAAAPLTAREALAKQIGSLPSLQEPASKGVNLRLATRPASLTLHPAIAAGYTALVAGDYASAKRHYAEAIAADTTSIDANLGFATAAARSGEPALAERHYRRVLEIDPRNVTAATALLTLAGNHNSLPQSMNLEVEIKRLLALDPTVAASHFALGNIYASQRRWSEAQPVYFEAVRLAPQNPDYAYNLAVSLDQLGQTKSAQEFYLRALSSKEHAQFDRAVVEKRLQTLTTPGSIP